MLTIADRAAGLTLLLAIAIACGGCVRSVPARHALPTPQPVEDADEEREIASPGDIQRWHDAAHGAAPQSVRSAAYREFAHMNAALPAPRSTSSLDPLQWLSIGPQPLRDAAGRMFTGAVRSLAIDPRDANVAYAGSASGGLWKTVDGGKTWTPLTDYQPSLWSGPVAISPLHPDTIYLATGSVDHTGAGILKSTDRGVSWTQLAGVFGGDSADYYGGTPITAMAISPSDDRVLLAGVACCGATPAGLYRSADGGLSWLPTGLKAPVGAVLFDPADPSAAYATVSAQGLSVYKSSDQGVSWTALTRSPRNAGGLAILSASPARPKRLYLSIADPSDGALDGMYRSDDGGDNWAPLAAPVGFCGKWCWYNPFLAADPSTPDTVFAGGLHLFRSTDAGKSWSNLTQDDRGDDTLHVDYHAAAFSADGSRMYVANDGGVFSSPNYARPAPTWTNLNATLGAVQFYSLSVDPTDANHTLGDTQDLPGALYNGSREWRSAAVCESGDSSIDPSNPNTAYVLCLGGGPLHVSVRGGAPDSWAKQPMSGIGQTDLFSWTAPFRLDPANSQGLYLASQRVYYSPNGGASWNPISTNLTTGDSSLTALDVSADGGTAYAGASDGSLYVTTNARDKNPLWQSRSRGLPHRTVSRIVVDPSSADIAYATMWDLADACAPSGHVYKTVDTGASWRDISGNLPALPAYDLELDPDLPGTLYLASELAVFRSIDDGASWHVLGAGLPHVRVRGVQLHRATRTLRVATYGRGMWDLLVPLTAPRIISVATQDGAAARSDSTLSITGRNFTVESTLLWNGAQHKASFVDSGHLTAPIAAGELSSSGSALVTVVTPGAGGGVSNPVEFAWRPVIHAGGVVNAASPYCGPPLAPGSIATVFGSMLADNSTADVRLDGIAAPVFYASGGQVNFQTPWELAGKDSARLTVTAAGQTSAPVEVAIAPAAPGIFTIDGLQGAIVSADWTLAAPTGAFPGSHPTKRGDFITIFATGLGPVTAAQSTGGTAPATPPAAVSAPVTLVFDCSNLQGDRCSVTSPSADAPFAGLTPGFVGLYQVNARIPAAAKTGNLVEVTLSVGGRLSNIAALAVE